MISGAPSSRSLASLLFLLIILLYHLLYENWLNYYVYQNTPYDLGEIQRVKHGK